MTHCLVTFLGGKALINESGEYKKVDYRFGDHTERAAFLGFPLHKWLQADRLVIFGTASSMWDHLFEGDLTIQGRETERLSLIEDVANASVSQEQLDLLAPQLAGHLDSEVQLKIIPATIEDADQQQILQMLSGAAEGADRLSIDVTHGFRYLPMLAVTAALCLRVIRPGLSIEGLWYGELGTGKVHDLRELLKTFDWLAALQRTEWLGDYSGIADLVDKDDGELADALRTASFLESIHQEQKAKTHINMARKRLENQILKGPGELFQASLLERLAWVDEQSLFLRQRRHAMSALERGDYLRASLYGFEAFITKLTLERFDPGQVNFYTVRQQAKDDFEAEKPHSQWKFYRLLRNLRNVLSHGNAPSTGEEQKAIHSRENLHAALASCLNKLLTTSTR